MGIRVVIDSRGVVETADSSTTDFTVNAPMSADSISVMPTVTSMSVGNTTLSRPGFYHLPGLNATGTMPAASTQPGAMYIFSQPSGDLGPGGFLTGSSGCSIGTTAASAAIFFVTGLSGSNGASPTLRANGVTLPKFGSVKVESDSKYWVVTQLSGSVSSSLFPAFG